jgi:hypothetical protein
MPGASPRGDDAPQPALLGSPTPAMGAVARRARMLAASARLVEPILTRPIFPSAASRYRRERDGSGKFVRMGSPWLREVAERFWGSGDPLSTALWGTSESKQQYSGDVVMGAFSNVEAHGRCNPYIKM